ncbi:unnamed protein product [Medioppia subpectinata]|uniref:C2 domain-containing protein n=1 Tax=Medioppia subpectinata TaxID=1979941 RepID=A0A7R9PTH9_9ACAR|nr:unnamed protein product [Medioppia subpectinata]CAG2100160.1 unnamed protein product [Medioppia subpectinata]
MQRSLLSKSDLKKSDTVCDRMKDLEIRCEFESYGCQHVSALKDLSQHMSACVYDPDRKCTTCGLIMGDVHRHNCIQLLIEEMEKFRQENNYSRIISPGHVTTEMMLPFETLAQTSATGGGNSSLPTSQIEMTLSCRNLLNRDITSKSDPFCLVQMSDAWSKSYYEIGRTETITDSLNPEWVNKFIINYSFETVQKLRFEVWDVDPNGKESLGHYETTLADIMAYPGCQFAKKLSGMVGNGEIIIVTEELSTCKQIVHMEFRAKSLKKMSCMCSNDPFLVFSRSNEDGTYSVVMKTKAVFSTQNPLWMPITMRVRSLCNGDYDRTIKIDCFDKRSNGDHKLIGSCFTNLRQLTQNTGENSYPIVNEKKKNDQNYTNSGFVEVVTISVAEEITFLDYIRGGTQMHFAVAIDFTASNGPPKNRQSLHYMDNSGRPNPYQIALRSVGQVIEPYNSAGIYPAFGFGAKIPPTWEVSHLFHLNGSQSHPYCSGVTEVLDHYRKTLSSVTLYGPTNFADVINNTASIARQYDNGKHYFVLLIITDGIISDMIHTKRAIIKASKLAMSIIIVGVGNANFAAMDELDSDYVRLHLYGEYADRDIVQFVPINKFVNKNGRFIRAEADLAKEVLREIPQQMTGYMRSRGFLPYTRVPNSNTDNTIMFHSQPIHAVPNAPPLPIP